MDKIVVAVIVSIILIGIVLVITHLSIKVSKLENTVDTIGEFFIRYMAHPENVDIIESIPIDNSDEANDFNFPNSEGGFDK